jgi:hypothetical protein
MNVASQVTMSLMQSVILFISSSLRKVLGTRVSYTFEFKECPSIFYVTEQFYVLFVTKFKNGGVLEFSTHQTSNLRVAGRVVYTPPREMRCFREQETNLTLTS